MDRIVTVGLDIAKSVFQVHAVDDGGKFVKWCQWKRSQMVRYFSDLPPALIGIEVRYRAPLGSPARRVRARG